jgi:hypothetical protein
MLMHSVMSGGGAVRLIACPRIKVMHRFTHAHAFCDVGGRSGKVDCTHAHWLCMVCNLPPQNLETYFGSLHSTFLDSEEEGYTPCTHHVTCNKIMQCTCIL